MTMTQMNANDRHCGVKRMKNKNKIKHNKQTYKT
jgi:hypothetical protein